MCDSLMNSQVSQLDVRGFFGCISIPRAPTSKTNSNCRSLIYSRSNYSIYDCARTHWKRRDEKLFPISRALTMDAAYRRKVSEHALSIPLLRFRILVTIGVCILHDDRYDSLTN